MPKRDRNSVHFTNYSKSGLQIFKYIVPLTTSYGLYLLLELKNKSTQCSALLLPMHQQVMKVLWSFENHDGFAFLSTSLIIVLVAEKGYLYIHLNPF